MVGQKDLREIANQAREIEMAGLSWDKDDLICMLKQLRDCVDDVIAKAEAR